MAGWSYAWIAQLSEERSLWTASLDVQRLLPRADTGRVTAERVTALVDRLGDQDPVPLFVFDTGYDPIALTRDLAASRA